MKILVFSTTDRYNKNDVIDEFKEFKRKIKLKADFAIQENHDINQLIYEQKSPWEPNKNYQAVNTFIKTIDNNIKNLLTKKLHFQNQTSENVINFGKEF